MCVLQAVLSFVQSITYFREPPVSWASPAHSPGTPTPPQPTFCPASWVPEPFPSVGLTGGVICFLPENLSPVPRTPPTPPAQWLGHTDSLPLSFLSLASSFTRLLPIFTKGLFNNALFKAISCLPVPAQLTHFSLWIHIFIFT